MNRSPKLSEGSGNPARSEEHPLGRMFRKATLTVEDLSTEFNAGESTIWGKVSPTQPGYDPEFPKPLPGRLGRHRIWLALDVEAYLLGLRSQRDQGGNQ